MDLEEALAKYGGHYIFNIGQACKFTSTLRDNGTRMFAGIGGRIDFYNRLWTYSSLGGLPPDRYHDQRRAKAA